MRKRTAQTLCAALSLSGLNAAFVPAQAEDALVVPSFGPQEEPETPPPPPPLSVFGDNMPEPGKATLSVIPTFANNSHSLIGTKGVSSQYIVSTTPWFWSPLASNVRIVPQNQFTQAQTVTLAYGIAKNLSIVLATGMVEKHSDLMTFYGESNLIPRGMSFPGTDSLQDSSAALIWRAYEDPIHRIKLNLGVSFPTGSNHNLGGALLQTGGGYTIGRAFYGMQSGTGTYDVLPGVMYAGRIAPWSWGLSYRARLPLTYNPQGYMWGNYQEVNAWGGYTWFPGFTTTIRANFNIQSPIAGADWLMPGKLQSANPNFYGGKRIEMYAGADIDGKLFGAPGFTIGVEGGVPVYQNLNGPQLSKNWQAGMALRWKIGDPQAKMVASASPVFKNTSLAATLVPVASWAGLYFGVNAGSIWAGDTDTNFSYVGSGGFVSLWQSGALPSSINLNSRGVLGGGQIGYNYQFQEKMVAGLEADLQGTAVGIHSSTSWQGAPATFLQAGRDQRNLGTVRARVGYLVTPTTLLYGTGGFAFGETDLNATYFSPLLKPVLNLGGSWLGYADMSPGWAAGAGVEWLFLLKWSLKAEYLHWDLGVANTAKAGLPLYYTSSKGQLSSVAYQAPFNGHVVRAGVNYHLNWGITTTVTTAN
ncbi:outer membrane beta-barrel protein [Methylocystis sp. IM3]|jgi:opacity protein-like surface antigen|uniref:outer membrane protein n=1 Tax=unclassified Methylocystis TaxID=2625913 RepID=UPI0030F92B34